MEVLWAPWRMAYIGTVCLVDKDGAAIKTYRYAATAAGAGCPRGFQIGSVK